MLATNIAARLSQRHGIASYLDVVDLEAHKAGDALGEYVRMQMSACTQLLAVVSEATKSSWWVPWEIGVATEKDFPLATFAGGRAILPEYLRRWPYLQSDADIDRYAEASKAANQSRLVKSHTADAASARRTSTQQFFRTLRGSLGQ